LVTVGDTVELSNGLSGTVLFIGEVQQRSGVYYGIELSGAGGKTNGTLRLCRK
jgi:dynactin complex subunit